MTKRIDVLQLWLWHSFIITPELWNSFLNEYYPRAMKLSTTDTVEHKGFCINSHLPRYEALWKSCTA